jgi:lipopolysaccharide transport system permease protein
MIKKTIFKQFADLLFAFTLKEIKVRYKTATLGFLWMFINPIIQMLVIGFVFSLLLKFGVKDYYLFLFTSLLAWNFFSLSLNKATPSIVYERGLIQKSAFPKAIIPLSIVFSNFFHLIVTLLLLLFFLSVMGRWDLFTFNNGFNLLINLVFLLFFTAGLTLITASLNVFWRDVAFFVQAIILIWFYATPIIYPLDIIPSEIKFLFYFNPLSGIFTKLQQPFLGTNSFPFAILIFQYSFTILLLILSFIIFNNRSRYFSDWL